MKYKLTLALVAALTSSAFAAFQAPMPEFKNEKQLAEWRAEKASESDTRSSTEDTAFYTGKPYLASSGGYAFKYRSYNPELARWTSEDPSGFPDGANGNIYSPVPTIEMDALGLSVRKIYTYASSVITIKFDVQIDESTGPTLNSASVDSFKAPFTTVTLTTTSIQNPVKTTPDGDTKWTFDLQGTLVVDQSIGIKITWPFSLDLTTGGTNSFPFVKSESYTFE